MKKVTGSPDYSVNVECPDCGHQFDATDGDSDDVVMKAMFKNTTESCTNMGIYYKCIKCDCDMILDELVY